MFKRFLILFCLPGLWGCINEDFSNTFNNTVIEPEYSVPMGSVDYSLDELFQGLGSLNPGPSGTIYYNDVPYPLSADFTIQSDTRNFNLNFNNDWLNKVEKLTFHVSVKNIYPGKIHTQVYFLNFNFNRVDSAFKDGPVLIPAAKTNQEGKVISSQTSIFDVEFSRNDIANFNKLVFNEIYCKFDLTGENGKPLKFYTENTVHISVGARVKLKIPAGEL